MYEKHQMVEQAADIDGGGEPDCRMSVRMRGAG